MTPTWGRSPRGKRYLGHAPFVCALSARGLLALLVLDGLINGPALIAWVEQSVVPELVAGDIVAMDNLSVHKVAGDRFLPSSRPCCAALRPARSRRSGYLLVLCWSGLALMGAKTTFTIAAISSQGNFALRTCSKKHERMGDSGDEKELTKRH